MKKLFLIPLMTLMCSVMAWGTPTHISDLEGFLSALSTGGEYVLGDNIDASEASQEELTVAASLTLDISEWALTLPELSCANEVSGMCLQYSGAGLQFETGVQLTIKGTEEGYIEGDFYSASFLLSPSTLVFDDDFHGQFFGNFVQAIGASGLNVEIRGGSFLNDPTSYLAEGYKSEEDYESAMYVVSEIPADPNVAQIGDTKYLTLTEALTAAAENATITLLQNADENVTITKSVTLTGNKKIKGSVTIDGNITLAMAGVTIESSSDAIIFNGAKTLNIVAQGETENAVYARSQYADCFYGMQNGVLNISGDGNLEVEGYVVFHVKTVNISARNLAAWGTLYDFAPASDGCSYSITAGAYVENPDQYLSAPYYTTHTDLYYRVANVGANVAVCNHVAYATLAEAVEAANAGDEIVLYADPETLAISKEVTIKYGSHNVSGLTAGADYRLINNAGVVNIMPANIYDLVEFLTKEGTHSFEVSANTDLSKSGQIVVNGTKTLTIPAGKTITYKRQSDGANILVAAGAKLTILGSGTIRPITGADINEEEHPYHAMYELYKAYNMFYDGNRAIDVNGELVVGAINDDDNCPHFITTSIARGSAITTNNGGITTINNANVQAANYAIWNEGTMYINGGIYTSTATTNNGVNGDWYGYCIRNQAKMVMKNATVVANHGAVSCEGGNGTLEIHNCNLQARNLSGLGGVHYALYVCTKSVVSAYDTKFYSENGSNTIVIGDNDSQNSFGLIYLYGGCKTDRKLYVQKKRGQDDDILFPVLVSEQSEWYKRALIGGQDTEGKLLPANTEYVAIDEQVYDINGDPIDGKKYSYSVVSTAAKTEDATGTTIPWQQNTTWTDTQVDHVPSAGTAVVIPAGKVVKVSKDEENKDAVAEQIFLADGAQLTVETGTTLKVGKGGVNIANGGQLVVEPGAIVTVGSTGLVTTEEEALVIEATEEDQGVFLLQPEVTENTQPKATIKLVTKCKQVAANEYLWERFAIPTIDGEETTFSIEGGTTGIVTYDGGAFQQGLYGWSDAQQDWVGLDRFKDMKPFKGYQLSNNSKNAGVTYVFEGNIVGNADRNYEFAQSGFGFFGNSYTGDIDIKKFLQSFGENMQKTIWIYDYYADAFKAITETNYGTIYYGTRKARHEFITDIRSMQAFLMNTFAEGQSNTTVDYSTAIWGNPKYNLVPVTPAPERVAANEDRFTVYVAGQKQEDEVSFIRNNAYSAAFDNGVDASKWMNNGLNLYVTTENGDMAAVASDEIVNMTIAFRSGNETEYTLGFDNLNGEQYSLRDVLTGQVIKMIEGATYTFSQEANTTVPARFQIVAADKVTTNIEDLENAASVQQKVLKNGTLYILRDNKWYTVQGQNVK